MCCGRANGTQNACMNDYSRVRITYVQRTCGLPVDGLGMRVKSLSGMEL